MSGNSSRCADLAKLHFCLVSSPALPVPDCSFYTVATYVRCYAPWYKSVIQLGVGLYSIHDLGPVALGCVYPVETSTLLYNLYLHPKMQLNRLYAIDAYKRHGCA